MARARKAPTSLDALEEIRQRRLALAHKRDEWARKRGEAERELSTLPDRRSAAMRAQARGEEAEVPEGGHLRAIVAEAIERDAAIRREEHDLTAEEHSIIDANLPFFDRLDVEAIQKAGAAIEQAAQGIRTAEAAIRAARGTHSTVRLARIRRGENPPQEMLPSDFAGAGLELNEARRVMGRYEQIMLGYQERHVASPGRTKMSSAEAAPLVEMI
jgi:hypothetical protein